MRIAVSFAIEIPDNSISALTELAAVDPHDRAGARRFVQAEAEQNLITYLGENGVEVVPIRGVALPDDYPTTATGSYDVFAIQESGVTRPEATKGKEPR